MTSTDEKAVFDFLFDMGMRAHDGRTGIGADTPPPKPIKPLPNKHGHLVHIEAEFDRYTLHGLLCLRSDGWVVLTAPTGYYAFNLDKADSIAVRYIDPDTLEEVTDAIDH